MKSIGYNSIRVLIHQPTNHFFLGYVIVIRQIWLWCLVQEFRRCTLFLPASVMGQAVSVIGGEFKTRYLLQQCIKERSAESSTYTFIFID